MRQTREIVQTIDSVADTTDVLEIELQPDIAGGVKLYVNVNGQTIVRIGRIQRRIYMTGIEANNPES